MNLTYLKEAIASVQKRLYTSKTILVNKTIVFSMSFQLRRTYSARVSPPEVVHTEQAWGKDRGASEFTPKLG